MSEPMMEYTRDMGVADSKTWRAELDATLQKLRAKPGSRERSLAVTKIQEAIMWLGMDLKRLNDGVSCYPGSYDPANKTVHPVADGLKM